MCDLAPKAFNALCHILSADRKFSIILTSDNVCSLLFFQKEDIL